MIVTDPQQAFSARLLQFLLAHVFRAAPLVLAVQVVWVAVGCGAAHHWDRHPRLLELVREPERVPESEWDVLRTTLTDRRAPRLRDARLGRDIVAGVVEETFGTCANFVGRELMSPSGKTTTTEWCLDQAAIEAVEEAYAVVASARGEGWETGPLASAASDWWRELARANFEASAFVAAQLEATRRSAEILDEALADPEFRTRWIMRFPSADPMSLVDSGLLDTTV